MSESQEELFRSPRSIQRASGSHEVSYRRDFQPSQSLCNGQPAEPRTALCVDNPFHTYAEDRALQQFYLFVSR